MTLNTEELSIIENSLVAVLTNGATQTMTLARIHEYQHMLSRVRKVIAYQKKKTTPR